MAVSYMSLISELVSQLVKHKHWRAVTAADAAAAETASIPKP